MLCHNQLKSSSRVVESRARGSLGTVDGECLRQSRSVWSTTVCFLHHTSSCVMIAAGESEEEEVGAVAVDLTGEVE